MKKVRDVMGLQIILIHDLKISVVHIYHFENFSWKTVWKSDRDKLSHNFSLSNWQDQKCHEK